MTQSNAIAIFTGQLAELVQHGVPVRKAVSDVFCMRSAHPKIRRLAMEIGLGMEEGRALSSVLAACTTVCFPQWYTAFVGAAEEKGCLGETFGFLAETLRSKQKSFASFVSAMVYPAVVVALCFASSVCAALVFPQFFANDNLAYRNGAAGSFFFASLFLLGVVFFAVCVLKLVTQTNPCVSLMSALAFLTKKGTSLSESLECAVPVVEKNERLCDAVLEIRENLLRGEPVEKAFSERLEEAGFASAAQIVSAQLAMAQAGGDKNVFERTAKLLGQKAEKVRASVLSCEQPVLLCCAAVYMLILLKNTLMPYMLGMGV